MVKRMTHDNWRMKQDYLTLTNGGECRCRLSRSTHDHFTSLAGKVSTIIVIDGHIESLSLIADLVPASGNLCLSFVELKSVRVAGGKV